jgi:hypothetical protein
MEEKIGERALLNPGEVDADLAVECDGEFRWAPVAMRLALLASEGETESC